MIDTVVVNWDAEAKHRELELRGKLLEMVNKPKPAGARPRWTCPAIVPLRLLIYAAFRSKAKGLFQPSAECFLRAL
ncbi:MAG: hypothetical protein ACJAX2_003080, partial [Celeribacter sp.]|jgi:hypothetical protein